MGKEGTERGGGRTPHRSTSPLKAEALIGYLTQRCYQCQQWGWPVVVTGPQCSGTTIAAKIIAHELAGLGYQFVPEEKFDTNDIGKWADILAVQKRVVVQCPTMCRYVHLLKEALVVLVVRNPKDILTSQERIGWGSEGEELARYGLSPDQGPVAKVKYEFWERVQRAALGDRAFPLDYESLSYHPLWVPKEKRASFGPR